MFLILLVTNVNNNMADMNYLKYSKWSFLMNVSLSNSIPHVSIVVLFVVYYTKKQV